MTDVPPPVEPAREHRYVLRIQRLDPSTAVEVTLKPDGNANTYIVTHDNREYGKVIRFWGPPARSDQSGSRWLWGAQLDHDPVKPCHGKAHAVRTVLIRGGLEHP